MDRWTYEYGVHVPAVYVCASAWLCNCNENNSMGLWALLPINGYTNTHSILAFQVVVLTYAASPRRPDANQRDEHRPCRSCGETRRAWGVTPPRWKSLSSSVIVSCHTLFSFFFPFILWFANVWGLGSCRFPMLLAMALYFDAAGQVYSHTTAP